MNRYIWLTYVHGGEDEHDTTNEKHNLIQTASGYLRNISLGSTYLSMTVATSPYVEIDINGCGEKAEKETYWGMVSEMVLGSRLGGYYHKRVSGEAVWAEVDNSDCVKLTSSQVAIR